MLLVNEETKEVVPFPQVLNSDRLLEDIKTINDSARSKLWTITQFSLAVMRNYDFANAPKGLGPFDLLRVIDGYNGHRLGFAEQARYKWRVVMVAGMWFQDLFNYDFRRTEMCIIPYGTQVGEVSFCAYNTGVGWRQIVEKIYQTASTSDWFQTKGRHKIYAAGRSVPLMQLKTAGAKAAAPVTKPEGACASSACGG